MYSMKYLIIIFSIFFLSSCADKNAKLIGNKANIYGAMGQRVTGDSNSVSIWNIWNAEDAKPVAEQHCQKYNKTVVSMSFAGITGYYKCGIDKNKKPENLFNNPDIKISISKVTNCLREKIIIYDDLKSDAKTIAEGVSQVCSNKFNDFADLYISKMKGSSEWEYSYKIKFKNSLNKAQAEQTLPFVLEWRSLLRRGWSKDKVPTSKEIPDNFFKVSI